MFDIGWDELLFTAVIAIIVVGPKDLPIALRTVGRWVAKARRVSNYFRSGIETMIREAEMEDMEKKWKAQNEAVMREHPGQEMNAQNAAGTGPLTPDSDPAAEASAATEVVNQPPSPPAER
jgi:sec-independent protein translocase protein TatB